MDVLHLGSPLQVPYIRLTSCDCPLREACLSGACYRWWASLFFATEELACKEKIKKASSMAGFA